MIDTLYGFGYGLVDAAWWSGGAWPVAWTLIKIVAVVLPLTRDANFEARLALRPRFCCSTLPGSSSRTACGT